jgi:ribosomal protein S16
MPEYVFTLDPKVGDGLDEVQFNKDNLKKLQQAKDAGWIVVGAEPTDEVEAGLKVILGAAPATAGARNFSAPPAKPAPKKTAKKKG